MAYSVTYTDQCARRRRRFTWRAIPLLLLLLSLLLRLQQPRITEVLQNILFSEITQQVFAELDAGEHIYRDAAEAFCQEVLLP